MTAHGFTLFDTTIGPCGIAWGERGIVGVQLPEGGEAETRERMLQRFPTAAETAPPQQVQHALDGIVALFAGDATDLSTIALDMANVPPFHRRVYEMARNIAPGSTLSYGEIAARLGARGAARAVGQALGHNPFPIVVPCHRVLGAGGKIGGFSAHGGIATKLRMLAIEAAQVNGMPAGLEGDRTLRYDPKTAVEQLRASDATLARVIADIGPFRMQLKRRGSLFAALAEAIVYQQLTGKAAATIFARVQALFLPGGEDSPTAEQILGASDDDLRGAGLSRSKLLSLRDLARRAVGGELPTFSEIRCMADEAVIERLTEVRGIGRWTAEMLLIFRLGRPDVLPADDYGVRKGFAAAYDRELPSRKDLETYGLRWKPYRSVASWYLWRVAERATAAKALPLQGGANQP